MFITFTNSSTTPFAASTIKNIEKQLKSNYSFNKEIYTRILVTELFARTAFQATLELFLACATLPFVAVKFVLTSFKPGLLSERIRLSTAANHLNQSTRCLSALAQSPSILINPKMASVRYVACGIIQPRHFDPKAILFDSLLKYAWTHQTAILGTACLVTAIVIQRSGLFSQAPKPTTTKESTQETHLSETHSDPEIDQEKNSKKSENPVRDPSITCPPDLSSKLIHNLSLFVNQTNTSSLTPNSVINVCPQEDAPRLLSNTNDVCLVKETEKTNDQHWSYFNVFVSCILIGYLFPFCITAWTWTMLNLRKGRTK